MHCDEHHSGVRMVFFEPIRGSGVSPSSSMNGPEELVTDEQAMWRVQQHGDHRAFTLLVERWQTPLHRLAVRLLNDEHRAEDVTQETFSRVFARRRDYRPDHRVSTWLWRITLNLCHDELRRRLRRPESSWDSSLEFDDDGSGAGPSSGRQIAADTATPAEHAALADTAVRVRQALQDLPMIYRSVVVLRHYESLKFSEIAAVLDIPEGTVKSRMFEGLARLAKALGPLLTEPATERSAAPLSTPSSLTPLATTFLPAPISP